MDRYIHLDDWSQLSSFEPHQCSLASSLTHDVAEAPCQTDIYIEYAGEILALMQVSVPLNLSVQFSNAI